MTRDALPCFCCSETPFSKCCEPVLADHAKALTPLTLMRSRYTAYVLKREDYLLATWDSSTRPKTLDLSKREVRWLGLTVHSSKGQPEDETNEQGEVEFTAEYIEADQLCTMHENSRFLKQAGLWYYLDGNCTVDQQKIGRNSPCPCGSKKKFKRCCLH